MIGQGLRVGYVTGSSKPQAGGAWTFIDGLEQAIPKAGSRHRFIRLDGLSRADLARMKPDIYPEAGKTPGKGWGQRATEAASDGAARVLFSSGRRRRMAIERAVRELGVDVVWYLHPRGRPVSAPFMITLWDLEHRISPYFPEVSIAGWTWTAREKWYSAILPRASFVLTGTEAGRRQIADCYGVNPDVIKVAPFFAPSLLAEGEETGGAPDFARDLQPRRFIFYPAQFWPHKNHANLLLAVDLLRREHGLKLDLVLTGGDKGNGDYVRRVVAGLGLSEQTRILGFVSREALAWLYRNAAVMAFPSFFGPDNIPPLEAFALGCPVAAARCAGAEEQLGEGALLFNPAKPQEIAEAIRRIYTDDALRARLVASGAEIASRRTAAAYVARICEVLDEFEPIRRCWGADYVHS